MVTDTHTPPRRVKVGKVTFANDLPFVLIAGPDSIESIDRSEPIIAEIHRITQRLGIPWVLKACFDKPQRTSITGWRGVGLKKAIELYKYFKRKYGMPITADFSTVAEARRMKEVVDLYQVQARLYRFTDILVAAGRFGGAVNLKRSQGESPRSIPGAIGKVASTGNENLMLTERGSCFGHNDLVVDFRVIPQLRETGYPVILDVSHTCQLPSAKDGMSGGERKYSPTLAQCGIAAGVAGIFMEVYDHPEVAPVDGDHSLLLSDLEDVLVVLKELDRVIKRPRQRRRRR